MRKAPAALMKLREERAALKRRLHALAREESVILEEYARLNRAEVDLGYVPSPFHLEHERNPYEWLLGDPAGDG